MQLELKKGQLRFAGADPMLFIEEDGELEMQWQPEQEGLAKAVSAAVRSYLKAAESLSTEQYANMRELIPEYLATPGNVLVAICSDGIVIRYEKKSGEKRRMVVTIIPDTIAGGAAVLSQNLVHIASPDVPFPESQDFGVEMRLSIFSPEQGVLRDISASRIWFQVENTSTSQSSAPGAKPFCLLSVRNQMNLDIHGILLGSDDSPTAEQPFIARSQLRLEAGWDCIEVFPGTDRSAWNADSAPLWADRDLLGAILIAQTAEVQINNLDPRAAARRQYAVLLKEFKDLLDANPEREQVLQTFLQNHPILLYPTQVRMWPKLQLGKTVTDFVFRDAVNNYLLVELERSTLPLFRQDGHPTAELTHAQGQVFDWKRYLEDNLQTVQRELGLTGITPNPNGLVVIGRYISLHPHDRRKLQTMMNESPKLRIMTYDDVYDNALAVFENLLGPIWDPGGDTRIYYPT